MHEWIDQYYPGTALAINEWNWGADETVNGALAIADVLGIFGREGVDMAAYWTYPPVGSPGAQAFRVFTNYDGAGGGFGDQSLPVTTSVDPDDVSVFANLDTLTDDVVLVAINKRPEAVIPHDVPPDRPPEWHARARLPVRRRPRDQRRGHGPGHERPDRAGPARKLDHGPARAAGRVTERAPSPGGEGARGVGRSKNPRP